MLGPLIHFKLFLFECEGDHALRWTKNDNELLIGLLYRLSEQQVHVAAYDCTRYV